MQKDKHQHSVKKTLAGYLLFGIGIIFAFISAMFIVIFFVDLGGNTDSDNAVFWGISSVFSIFLTLWCLIYSQKILNPKSSPYHPSQPILHMGHAWVENNDILTEYSDIEFNGIDNVLILNTDNHKTVIQFSEIKKISTDNNLNSPSFYVDTSENKRLTIYFVKTAEDVQKLTSNTYKIKRLVLGEALTNATIPVSTIKSTYSQIVMDRISIIERWLKHHKVNAYKNILYKNTRAVLSAVLIPLSVIGLLYLYIYFTNK